jgi:hypothetical protein
MGTNSHKPDASKTEWHGVHDSAARAAGPGERPGVPSRIEAARRRRGLP